jgi:hypothetical protein
MKRLGLPIVGFIGVMTLAGACTSTTTSVGSQASKTEKVRPASASLNSTICKLVFPNGVGGGRHCTLSRVKVSTADANWVYSAIGIYSAQDQLASDLDLVIVNLTTHQVIGPTNVGFCGVPGGAVSPTVAYGAIPTRVLTGLGLRPCSTTTSTTMAGTTVPTTQTSGSPSYASLAGTWGAHEMTLTISSNGSGDLKYADLTLCPDCSFASAPVSTMAFALTSLSGNTATGTVTASSDTANYAVGAPVTAMLTPGSPGQLLQLQVGGKSLVPFCNSTSVGQCGA